MHLTQVAPTYSVAGRGGLSANRGRVRSALRHRGHVPGVPGPVALARRFSLPELWRSHSVAGSKCPLSVHQVWPTDLGDRGHRVSGHTDAADDVVESSPFLDRGFPDRGGCRRSDPCRCRRCPRDCSQPVRRPAKATFDIFWEMTNSVTPRPVSYSYWSCRAVSWMDVQPWSPSRPVGGELLLSPQSVEIIKFGDPGSGR